MNPNEIVNELLDESLVKGIALLEDRISELAAKFQLDVEKVKEIAGWDPTRNKKYLPWLVARFAANDEGLSQPTDVTTALQQFERLQKLPAFQASKDIQAYPSVADLQKMVEDNSELAKTKEEKARAGAKIVSKDSDLTLVKIEGENNYETLMWYSRNNVLNPPTPNPPELLAGHTNWCVRCPDHAKSHLRQGPFYIVLKGNKTYLAIHPASGQVKNTDQFRNPFTGGQANEISRLVAKEMLASQDIRQFRGDMKHFISVIDLPAGSTIDDNLDYSNTKGRKLPPNLTVNGSLNLENSDIAEIPPGLKVKGDLNIKGTPIQSLSDATVGSRLLRDADFPMGEVFNLVYRVKMPQMKENFIMTRTTKGYKEKGQMMPPVSREEAEAAWPKMQEYLKNYYANLVNLDKIADPEAKRRAQEFAQRVINEIS